VRRGSGSRGIRFRVGEEILADLVVGRFRLAPIQSRRKAPDSPMEAHEEYLPLSD